QAEDGIRDGHVTGVQTCALPILPEGKLPAAPVAPEETLPWLEELPPRKIVAELDRYIVGQEVAKKAVAIAVRNRWRRSQAPEDKIGRASCRERVGVMARAAGDRR